MPNRPRPASLSDVDSVDGATPTPSWEPSGKERRGGVLVWGWVHLGLCRRLGGPDGGGSPPVGGVGGCWRGGETLGVDEGVVESE